MLQDMYYLGSGPFFYVLYAFVLACSLQTGTILSIQPIFNILSNIFLLLLLEEHFKNLKICLFNWFLPQRLRSIVFLGP